MPSTSPDSACALFGIFTAFGHSGTALGLPIEPGGSSTRALRRSPPSASGSPRPGPGELEGHEAESGCPAACVTRRRLLSETAPSSAAIPEVCERARRRHRLRVRSGDRAPAGHREARRTRGPGRHGIRRDLEQEHLRMRLARDSPAAERRCRSESSNRMRGCTSMRSAGREATRTTTPTPETPVTPSGRVTSMAAFPSVSASPMLRAATR